MIPDFIRNNQIAGGGLLVLGAGALLAWLAAARSAAWAWLVARFSTSVEIRSVDPLFEEVESWLGRHAASRRRRLLTASTRRTWTDSGESARVRLVLAPGPGRHVVRHAGTFLIVDRERQESRGMTGRFDAPRELETLTLTCLGRSRKPVDDLLEQCRRAIEESDDGCLRVHVSSASDGWKRIPGRPRRRLETVCLPAARAAELSGDLGRFLGSEAWYAERGLPYRRGYLFHGPPGTGKTSTVEALASEHGLALYRMPLSSRLTDDELVTRVGDVPPRSILLLEDVDACQPARERSDGLTLSGLLNSLDGVTTPHGLVAFMTTNHVERLDPALVRPGRCDVRLEFGHAAPDQARAMYLRFFPGEVARAEEFALSIAAGESPAALQERLLAIAAGREGLRPAGRSR